MHFRNLINLEPLFRGFLVLFIHLVFDIMGSKCIVTMPIFAQISDIRQHLMCEATTLANALAGNCLDYCNFLFRGLSVACTMSLDSDFFPSPSMAQECWSLSYDVD